MSTFVRFLRNPPAAVAARTHSSLTRNDHVALLRRPEVYRRRERLRVTLQLDVLPGVAAHQLIRNGQHRRNCNAVRLGLGSVADGGRATPTPCRDGFYIGRRRPSIFTGLVRFVEA